MLDTQDHAPLENKTFANYLVTKSNASTDQKYYKVSHCGSLNCIRLIVTCYTTTSYHN